MWVNPQPFPSQRSGLIVKNNMFTLIQFIDKITSWEQRYYSMWRCIFTIREWKNDSRTVFIRPVSWGSPSVSGVSLIQIISSLSSSAEVYTCLLGSRESVTLSLLWVIVLIFKQGTVTCIDTIRDIFCVQQGQTFLTPVLPSALILLLCLDTAGLTRERTIGQAFSEGRYQVWWS